MMALAAIEYTIYSVGGVSQVELSHDPTLGPHPQGYMGGAVITLLLLLRVWSLETK
jgi:hypothetical protein